MNEAQYHGLMLLTILTAYNFLGTFDEKELKIKKQRKKAINDVLNENDKNNSLDSWIDKWDIV